MSAQERGGVTSIIAMLTEGIINDGNIVAVDVTLLSMVGYH
jgi:hypothetical protein